MAWVKLDDGFLTHPKALRAGKDGRALIVAGLLYSARELTGGHIDPEVLPIIAAAADVKPAVARRLVEIGSWHGPGHDCDRCPAITEGFVIHDYHDHQPRAEAVRDKRRKRAEAGRIGGQRSKPQTSNREPNNEAKSEASDEANEKQNGTPSPYPSSVDLPVVVSPPVPADDDDLLISIARARAQRLGRQPTDAWLKAVATSLDAQHAHALAASGMHAPAIDIELDRSTPTSTERTIVPPDWHPNPDRPSTPPPADLRAALRPGTPA